MLQVEAMINRERRHYWLKGLDTNTEIGVLDTYADY